MKGFSDAEWSGGQKSTHTVFSNTVVIGDLGESHFSGLEGASGHCSVKTKTESSSWILDTEVTQDDGKTKGVKCSATLRDMTRWLVEDDHKEKRDWGAWMGGTLGFTVCVFTFLSHWDDSSWVLNRMSGQPPKNTQRHQVHFQGEMFCSGHAWKWKPYSGKVNVVLRILSLEPWDASFPWRITLYL